MIERRSKARFPVVERVWWRRSKSIIGVGQTINLSSSGTLLRVDHNFRMGERVEVAIDLPVCNEDVKLQLKAIGRVVRLEKDCVAIKFTKQDLWRTPSRIDAVDDFIYDSVP
jgi:hypothetical protein